MYKYAYKWEKETIGRAYAVDSTNSKLKVSF